MRLKGNLIFKKILSYEFGTILHLTMFMTLLLLKTFCMITLLSLQLFQYSKDTTPQC